MILLIQDRKGGLHLVDYTPPSGNKFTICGIVYRKMEILNTFALDNAVPGICRTCYEDYKTMYDDDLNNDIRMAHSSLDMRLKRTYLNVADMTPEIEYWDMSTKNWEKLNKYTRKVLRNPNVIKRK